MKKLLNLGCGNKIHKDWINVDFNKTGDNVVAYDLKKGIPFKNNEFDLVYHSHLLEHFSKKQGEIFIHECHRVLKPGGIIRVAVPDLEQIVLEYIGILKKLDEGDEDAKNDYNWIMLELYDQTVRNYSGGMMSEYICQNDLPNERFLYQRLGQEARSIRYDFLNRSNSGIQKPQNLYHRILKDLFWKFIKSLTTKSRDESNYFKAIGKFRESGEVHQWMYDRHSLRMLLNSVGFDEIKVQTSSESYLVSWNSYHLDTLNDGSTRKPDSIFMEAIK
jgi:predicted SAM-dependent methyltransferase